MNPFLTSLSSWSILLQTVKGASRSFILSSCLWLLASPTSPAQQNGIDQDSEIIIVPGGKNILRWHAHAGRSYFVQVSDPNDPLRKWKWATIIDAANNRDISHEVGGSPDKAFFRLKYTNQVPGPNETLDTADFDQDGLSNLDEIAPPPPLLASDATDPLDPDTDHDGLTDGYERTNGLDPNDPGTTNPDNGPNGDPDGDGLTNAEEEALGTDPKKADTDGDGLNDKQEGEIGTDPKKGDTDDDGLNDSEDAVPLDGEINWKKAPESKYVWIEQVNDSPDHGTPLAVNKHGQILFTQSSSYPIVTSGPIENILWSSKLHDWVDIASTGSQNLNATWGGYTLATIEAPALKFYDINDDGVIYGQSLGVEDGNLGIRPGMIWKKTSPTSDSYSSPNYFFPQFPLPAPTHNDYGIEVTTGLIANDGTINSFVYQDKRESVSWMTYNSRASAPTFSMDSVKAFNNSNGNAGTQFGKSFAGAILDKDRALFVETTTSSTGVDDCNLWLKEGATQTDLSFMTPHPVSLAEMSYTANHEIPNNKRLWITTGSSVFLEKKDGGTGAGRWHQPPSMQIGASLLHSSGIGLKGSEILTSGETTLPWLWRNGKYSGLNNPSLTSKPTAVEITDVIDIASNGIILAKATEGTVKKTGLLLPVEVVDKTGVSLSELKVGKMYPNVLTGNGLNGDPVNVDLDKDEDRFFVRVKGADSLGPIKMKFETVDNAESMYNDDATEYTLESKDGYATTKSMVLVSDDVDDNHLVSTGGAPDNSPDDRTHIIQLGGNFKISAIKFGEGSWMPVDVKLPVKKKKTVKVQFVNCTYMGGNLCWPDPSLIEFTQRKMRQRYAQVGVDFDFLSVLTGASVGLLTGTMTNSEIISFPSPTGKIIIPQATKDLVDHGPPNDLHNTLMIYLVQGLGTGGNEHRGIATPPKYVDSVDNRFKNKVFLAIFDHKDFTAAHEALHVLADATHGAAPYNDFSTEYADMHTIWTVPPNHQKLRRDNGSIGSTKRTSLAQEVKIHSSPLAK